MSNINVTYDQMKDSAGRLRQGQDSMNQTLHELGTLIDDLITSGFQTDLASASYNEQFDQFQTGTKTAIDALEGLASFLDSAAEAMQNTDTELSNAIKG
jgi:WXG100 family type VII secretion target